MGSGEGGGKGGARLSPLGTYDSLLHSDWLHASSPSPALHCIHGAEKSWCYQKHADSQSESEWRGGGEDEGTGTVVRLKSLRMNI